MTKNSLQFETLQNYSEENFRRLTGVKRATFDAMLEILEAAHTLKKAKGGRPNKLSVSAMLLMALEYLREYPTYLRLGTNFGLSESVAYKNIKWVENTLIESEKFRLAGKKSLVNADSSIEVVLVDVTESPIERPQKTGTEVAFLWQEEAAHHKVASCSK